MAPRLFRRGVWHRLAAARRRDAVACDRCLPSSRGRRGLARDEKTVRVLDLLSVCAVCDAADRSAGPRHRALGRVGGAWPAMDDKQEPKGIVLTEAQKKSRRERSIAIALALGVLVALFFAVTMVKGPAVLVRPM